MPSVWIEALRKFNEGKSSWMLPKKDSPEHAQVVKIMNRMKAAAPAPAPAPAKAAKVAPELPTKEKKVPAPAAAPKKAKKVEKADTPITPPEESTVDHLSQYKKIAPKPTEKKAKVVKVKAKEPVKKRAPKKVVAEVPESDAETAESE
jgi:hypothetical protein